MLYVCTGGTGYGWVKGPNQGTKSSSWGRGGRQVGVRQETGPKLDRDPILEVSTWLGMRGDEAGTLSKRLTGEYSGLDLDTQR